jgi:hypothetical protein
MPQIAVQQADVRLVVNEQCRQFLRQTFAVGDEFSLVSLAPGQFKLRQKTLAREEERPGALFVIELRRAADKVGAMPAVTSFEKWVKQTMAKYGFK